MDPGLIVVVLVLLVVGGGLAYLLLRAEAGRRGAEGRVERLAEVADGLARQQQELTGRFSQLAEQNAAERAELSRALQERLDGVSKRLGDGLEKSATRTAETLGTLTKHLNVIDAAQKNITDLAGQVVGLQDILDNKQARGAFGEVQLQDLVSAILPPSAYDFQVQLSNGRRVDCLVRLPQPPGPIGIDSKFPLESYHALRAAEDESQAKQAAREFRVAILKHVQDIRERYIVPGETADSALMFLPSEAVYAELHANFADAVEQSYRQKVWIVSPTTLMATLNTVRAVLKDARMREQAGVIQTEVQKLLDDVHRLDKRVENLGRHFDLASKDVREIATSSEKIVRRADRIEEVQLEEAEAEPSDTALAPPATALSGD
ncbi:MAG: DNA recombination protein RmuC [Alphaproteobacteria bacterium]|nr:DNA recombination protein RmuC [Alphaproteobacteria bacterium]